MSVKNQKPLFISAAVIILLTVTTLFGLNFLVERISKLSPPPLAKIKPKIPPTRMPGKDDAVEDIARPKFEMPVNGRPPALEDQAPPTRMRRVEPRERGRDDTFRRIRNGKDSPDLRRVRPPTKQPARDDATAPTPPIPPNVRDQYYPPPPLQLPEGVQLDPAEQERLQQELERRQQMYYPPPPYYPPQEGFEPPPYPPEGYDNGYEEYPNGPDDFYDNEYDYDYDSDLEGKIDTKTKSGPKTAKVIDNIDEDFIDEDAFEEDLEDDYLYEYYED